MAQPYAPLLQQMLSEFQSQRHDAAERIAQSILRINPKDLIALQVLGLVLAMQGRVLEAVDPLSKAALQDSKKPRAPFKLGASSIWGWIISGCNWYIREIKSNCSQ